MVEHAADTDIIIGWVVPKGILELAVNLKLLCWLHAGCDELDYKLLKSRNVKLTNISGVNNTAVAEHAMGLMLGLAKRILLKHRSVVEGFAMFPLYEDGMRAGMLDGRSLAIIGHGSIGSEIARRAKAFDMRIMGVRLHPDRPTKHADEVYGTDQLHEVLNKADYVVLATPITRETDHFFGEAEFRAMQKHAYLINIARGNLIQEMPLYEALTEKRIAGFGSDVWYNYENSFPASYHFPVPSRTGVHKLDNVLCSGDQGANADDVLERVTVSALKSLGEFLNDQPLTKLVDLDLGY